MLSILLVDDEPTIRLALGDALARAGHRVKRASNGGEALALGTTEHFDVVVADVSMPVIDGITLLRRLRISSPGTDVLLMTAYGRVPDVIRAFKLGAEDYMTKPFTDDELLARIQRIEERRNQSQEKPMARYAVWMDRQNAKIFKMNDLEGEVVLHWTPPAGHGHPDDPAGHESQKFYEQVAQQLKDAKGILITGPGVGHTQFKHHLDKFQPALAKLVIGVETADHPTDGQIQAHARKRFNDPLVA